MTICYIFRKKQWQDKVTVQDAIVIRNDNVNLNFLLFSSHGVSSNH